MTKDKYPEGYPRAVTHINWGGKFLLYPVQNMHGSYDSIRVALVTQPLSWDQMRRMGWKHNMVLERDDELWFEDIPSE